MYLQSPLHIYGLVHASQRVQPPINDGVRRLEARRPFGEGERSSRGPAAIWWVGRPLRVSGECLGGRAAA